MLQAYITYLHVLTALTNPISKQSRLPCSNTVCCQYLQYIMYCVSDTVTICKRVAYAAESARGILAVEPVRLLESDQAAVGAQLSRSLRTAAAAFASPCAVRA